MSMGGKPVLATWRARCKKGVALLDVVYDSIYYARAVVVESDGATSALHRWRDGTWEGRTEGTDLAGGGVGAEVARERFSRRAYVTASAKIWISGLLRRAAARI
jgi:hypothetical protein